ncbi:hypothetical protein H5089_07955 [Pseudoalteromonas sp. SR45-1]|uniref:hypothetical protein n=1 Tax=Pseudoalteromonas sp. SR45-1 TaxID=2760932 RepID=UPI0016038C44|nr:hypothetical protein [Pseudoalteromonas sp. SR45-1]MBB1325440.1 hypothetical protein [Pseudoalteromonas sp. SR45-1]
MTDTCINISLIPNYFANKKYCDEVLEDLDKIKDGWLNINNGDEAIEKRGVYLTILNSNFKLKVGKEVIDFRKVLFINTTEDIKKIKEKNSVLPIQDENLLKTDLKNVKIETLENLELWFLPISGSSQIRKTYKENMIKLFNPPYNIAMQRVVKAATQKTKSIPAF